MSVRNPNEHYACGQCGKELTGPMEAYDWPGAHEALCQDCYWDFIDKEIAQDQEKQKMGVKNEEDYTDTSDFK